MIGLTHRQADLLRFIAGYQIAHGGVSPCFREMRAAMGGVGPSAMHRMLTALEVRVAIRRLPRQARAIEIVAMPAVPMFRGRPLFVVPTVRRCMSAFSGERL